MANMSWTPRHWLIQNHSWYNVLLSWNIWNRFCTEVGWIRPFHHLRSSRCQNRLTIMIFRYNLWNRHHVWTLYHNSSANMINMMLHQMTITELNDQGNWICKGSHHSWNPFRVIVVEVASISQITQTESAILSSGVLASSSLWFPHLGTGCPGVT